MAAVAKFISYDGGVAFSESSLKMQKADEERGRIIPLPEVASITVAAPTSEDEGKIIVLLQGERRPSRENVLYYEDEQHEEALQFKAAFDRITRRRRSEAARPRQVRTPQAEARRQTGTAPARPRQVQAEKAPAKKGKLKKIVLWVVGVYVALLAVGGISLFFDKDGQNEADGGGISTTEPSAVSDAFATQDGAGAEPDADSFIEQARVAAEASVSEGEKVTAMTLEGRDLNIIIDCSASPYLAEYDDALLLVESDQVVEPILALGERYDVLWDTMTVDYGEFGKVVKNKDDLTVWDDPDNGIYNRRYFEPVNETVIRDDGGGAGQESAEDALGMTANTVQAGNTLTAAAGYTSPPVVTNPPVTAAPEQKTERMVWIPTQGGSKYHSNSSCSGMNGPVEVTISEAEARGFEPCGKCY